MAELQDKDKLTQEALALQTKLTDGNITEDEKKRLEELKVLLKGGGKQEKVKFKVKSDAAEKKEEQPKPEEKKKQPEIKEAKVIEVPDIYERKSSYDIDDIKKKIDRLDSEGVGSLKDRYKEKYGEDLYVPDLHSDNVREALEDVKPYLEIDEFDEEQKAAEKDDEEAGEDEEKKEKEEEDTGPSFFARLIGAIKAFFKKIFSRKNKKEKKPAKVEDAAVAAVSNGE